jgi:solute carrier family 25 phosphate transporter 3
MQVSPEKYPGLMAGLRLTYREEGIRGLIKGWGPTAVGYSAQGAFKFGCYEIFKDFYSNLLGEEKAYQYRGVIYAVASGSGEFLADIALCPWEMTKIKMQTSPQGTFPTEFGAALREMRLHAKETRFPFGSLIPLWGRQIPYSACKQFTMIFTVRNNIQKCAHLFVDSFLVRCITAIAKFYFFEKVVEAFYTYAFTQPKESYSKPTQLSITFASGYIAGVICAIVSHPADSLVSLMGKTEHKKHSVSEIARQVGFRDLMLKGLGPRILMIGTLTGLQWWIYDTFKTALGMGTTGGAARKAN